jgi:hypothetical protein
MGCDIYVAGKLTSLCKKIPNLKDLGGGYATWCTVVMGGAQVLVD